MGIILGAKVACLWAEKGSWMHKWYERRGYKDYKEYDENHIWMKKNLI